MDDIPTHLLLPIQAAKDIIAAHGIVMDRCDILQDGNTLVLRLNKTLVARIVQIKDGPRQGTAWFAKENAIAEHLTGKAAPVIPLHPDLPPGPHYHRGYPMNFWSYVTSIDEAPLPAAIGQTLYQCHQALCDFPQKLPELAILHESLKILEHQSTFNSADQQLLEHHLKDSLSKLQHHPHQALHGDAHLGNLMNTTTGLVWTDWEDAFSGPVEWDLASVIWNALILENQQNFADDVLDAYVASGGSFHQPMLQQCLRARAAVMSTWYPILYPNPDAERRIKLQQRLEYLRSNS